MTARFIRTAGEAIDGDWCETTCPWCASMHCDCEEVETPSARSPEQLAADVAAAEAHIARCFAEKIEADLRFTMEMQRKRRAA